MAFEAFLNSNGWSVVKTLTVPSRARELCPVDDLPLGEKSRRFLARAYADGIYRHQKEALLRYLAGQDVCLTTGTASGKSLAFQVAALHELARDPEARILAIYPMKALGREQEDRWQAALERAGLPLRVGRIDGNIPVNARLGILRQSSIIVCTPDILHAWFMFSLSERDVRRFLSKVALIVVDEVHVYTGVFGSNSAFLFRRLQHVMSLLGRSPRYVAASATIADPAGHLKKLIGVEFSLVGADFDSSPRHPITIHLVNPPARQDFLTEIVALLQHLTHDRASRFIAFADSRK